MKENSKYKKLFSNIILYLSILLFVKIVWSLIFFIYLPIEGESNKLEIKDSILFYRVKIAHPIPRKKVVRIKRRTKIKKTRIKKVNTRNIDNIKNLILLGIYKSFNKKVITVQYKRKIHILSKGEEINKFIFDSVGYNYAIFLKNDKAYRIFLFDKKNKNKRENKPKRNRTKSTQNVKKDIVFNNNETPIIPKLLLKEYTQDINKAWNNIGISDYVKNSKITGFRINYIKRGSDFEKIGLKRGDILKSINGEALNNYNIAFSFYKKINTLDDITIMIERNNQEMELEYEIK